MRVKNLTSCSELVKSLKPYSVPYKPESSSVLDYIPYSPNLLYGCPMKEKLEERPTKENLACRLGSFNLLYDAIIKIL